MDLSTEHLLAVVAIAFSAATLVAAARLRPGRWTRVAGFALACLLVGAEVGWWIYLAGVKNADLSTALPLQLCDAGIFVAAFALVLRTQLLVEVTYFWGLAGTIQALITPEVPDRFPKFPYFQYYFAHGGIITAALFLVVGLGLWPRLGAVLRVFVVTVTYTLIVGAIDAATGANYMFLRAKPSTGSLLDLLGPWPWYVAWAGLIAAALFTVLYLPFFLLRRRSTLVANAHQARL
jgi:hypothetical integral membrane protein (TIGR02206 family)